MFPLADTKWNFYQGGGHDRSIKEKTRNPSEFFKGKSVAENIQAIREKIESKSSNDRDCRRNMVETFRKFGELWSFLFLFNQGKD